MKWWKIPKIIRNNQNSRLEMLYYMSLSLIGICLFSLLLPFLIHFDTNLPVYLGTLVGGAISGLYIHRLVLKGKSHPASVLTLVTVFLIVTITAFINGGVRSPVFICYIFVIGLTDLLFNNSRVDILVTVLSILSGAGMLFALWLGWIRPVVGNPFYEWMADSAFFCLMLIVQKLSVQIFQQIIRRAAESEQKNNKFVSESPFGIYRASRDGKFLEANPSMLRLLGYESLEELQKVNVKHARRMRTGAESEMLSVLQREENIYGWETTWEKRDGTLIHLRENANWIRAKDGSIYLEGTAEDISPWKAAEAQAERQRRSLVAVRELAIELGEASSDQDYYELATNKMLELTGAMIVVLLIFIPEENVLEIRHLASDGKISLTQVNQVLGESVIGMRLPINSQQKEFLLRRVVSHLESFSDLTFGYIPESIGGILQKTFEIGGLYTITLKHERMIYGTMGVLTPLGMDLLDEDMLNASARVVSVSIRRQQAEDKLRSSELRFRSLIQNTNDIIILMEASGKLIYESQAVSRLLGYPPGELTHRNVFDLIHPEDVDYAYRAFTRLVERTIPEDIPIEFRFLRKDGIYVTLENLGKNLLADPDVGAILLTLRDVSERKRAEEELKRVNRALRATGECNQALVRATDEINLLQSICDIIVYTGGYPFTCIGYVDVLQKAQAIQVKARAGEDHGYFQQIFETLMQMNNIPEQVKNAIAQSKPVILNHLQELSDDPEWHAELARCGLSAGVLFPLQLNDSELGFWVILGGEAQVVDQSEFLLLEEMAADLTFGIQMLRVRQERDRANRLVAASRDELQQAYDSTLEGWARALELRERDTAGHSMRVVEMTLNLARHMGVQNEEELVAIRRGALLHDIGKMAIPDMVLLKPGPLNDDEWRIMRMHPVYAYQMLSNIPYLKSSLDIPYLHHERWDGSGYPLHLKGEEIPLAARIFAVVDVWDALISDRPYRPAWYQTEIRFYLSEKSGILFDPAVVETFLKIMNPQKTYLPIPNVNNSSDL